MKTIYYEQSKKSGIYKIFNILNNRIYFGSAKSFKIRCSQHLSLLRKNKHHNKFLQGDFNKFGEENFVFEVMQVISGTMEERIVVEQQILDLYYDNQKLCYNLSCLAHRNIEGIKQSNKIKKQKSMILKERWKNNSEYRKKMLEINSNRKMSLHVRQSLYNALIGNKHFFGKKHSIETLKKMSIAAKKRGVTEKTRNAHKIAMIGRKLSVEQKKKISNGNKGKVISDYQKLKTSESNSKTYNIILISPEKLEFGPITNIRKFCLRRNLLPSKIYLVINKKRKHHKGWTLKQ